MKQVLSLILCLLLPLTVYSSEEDIIPQKMVTIVAEIPSKGPVIYSHIVENGKLEKSCFAALGKSFELSKEQREKFVNIDPNSLSLTHEVGYTQTGGYSVHCSYIKRIMKDGKIVSSRIVMTINDLGLSFLEIQKTP